MTLNELVVGKSGKPISSHLVEKRVISLTNFRKILQKFSPQKFMLPLD